MSKDRNTFAKRQREVEKKRKADEKRVRRAKKKVEGNEPDETNGSSSLLSSGENSVLGVFRKYQMTPGKMLCFANPDLETFNTPLAELTDKGMLVEEKAHGGYSLTETGFAAMKDGE
jgi:hypothetical protein